EISLCAPTQVSEVHRGAVRSYELRPAELGLPSCELSALAGGDSAHNAKMIRDVLGGQKGPPRDAVLANAGAALYVAAGVGSLRDGVVRAAEVIDSGAAMEKLEA